MSNDTEDPTPDSASGPDDAEARVQVGFVAPEDLSDVVDDGKLLLGFDDFDIDDDVIGLVPAAAARKYEAVPLNLAGGQLLVAMIDPANADGIADLSEASGFDVAAVAADEDEVLNALLRLYPKDDEVSDDGDGEVDDGDGEVNDGPLDNSADPDLPDALDDVPDEESDEPEPDAESAYGSGGDVLPDEDVPAAAETDVDDVGPATQLELDGSAPEPEPTAAESAAVKLDDAPVEEKPPFPTWMPSAIESLLLVTPEPVTVRRLKDTFAAADEEVTLEEVKAAVDDLTARWNAPDRTVGHGLRIVDIGGGYTFYTAQPNARFIHQLRKERPTRLSKAALETLSIVAYRQPVTKPQMEEIRGVDCAGAVKSLMERGLVRVIGKADDVGRPLLYGTTKGFLAFFGIRSLHDLPTLRQLQELEGKDEPDALPAGDQGPVVVRDLFDPNEGGELVSDETRAESDRAMESLQRALGEAKHVDARVTAMTDPDAEIPENWRELAAEAERERREKEAQRKQEEFLQRAAKEAEEATAEAGAILEEVEQDPDYQEAAAEDDTAEPGGDDAELADSDDSDDTDAASDDAASAGSGEGDAKPDDSDEDDADEDDSDEDDSDEDDSDEDDSDEDDSDENDSDEDDSDEGAAASDDTEEGAPVDDTSEESSDDSSAESSLSSDDGAPIDDSDDGGAVDGDSDDDDSDDDDSNEEAG